MATKKSSPKHDLGESAQKVWLAGLGALSIAEREGSKVFRSLVDLGEEYLKQSREPVEQALAAGRDVLFDIDWQGTQQICQKMRSDVVSVFVLPPSAAELKARLERRAEDSGEIIARRLRNAAEEIPHWTEYDYVLINCDLDESFARLRAILTAERLKRILRSDLETRVAKLLADLKQVAH